MMGVSFMKCLNLLGTFSIIFIFLSDVVTS